MWNHQSQFMQCISTMFIGNINPKAHLPRLIAIEIERKGDRETEKEDVVNGKPKSSVWDLNYLCIQNLCVSTMLSVNVCMYARECKELTERTENHEQKALGKVFGTRVLET